MKYLVLFLFAIVTLSAQRLETPFEKSGFTKNTSYEELIAFLNQAVSHKKEMKVEYIAESAKGRKIPVVKFSEGEFGSDNNKLRILVFAQQHGNEPSGKEGMLMILADMTEGKLDYMLHQADLAVIPMMNPDGNEADTRRNGNNADLNRDHLIMMQPETRGLHQLYNKYQFDVNMDVHEYSPYSTTWTEFGYLKNSEVTVGTLTNMNIAEEMRAYQIAVYMPFIKQYISAQGFSFEEYLPGGPPEKELIRRSTYDINDGRQSIGSLGAFSFIQEGMNGRNQLDNLERRAKGQHAGVKGFLMLAVKNKNQIKNLVENGRKSLLAGKPDSVAVQMTHALTGETRTMALLSVSTGKDTLVTVKNYRPVVKSRYSVAKPKGYLIPADDEKLTAWTERHGFRKEKYIPKTADVVSEYNIVSIDSVDFEGDIVVDAGTERSTINPTDLKKEYWLLPVNQLAGNVIVQALEPKSEIGLVTYKMFEYLLVKGEKFPVLRLEGGN